MRGMGAIFVGSDIYRLPAFAPPHPLAIPRAMLVADLCVALKWLDESYYVESPMAASEALCRFHSPDYIAALRRAEAEQDLPREVREATRIGADSNPIHQAVFRRPAISAGGALLAASRTAGGGTVFAPGVGNHHGRRDRASGFCFVNDIALGILRWQDLGLRRIAYLDLDAHHGDGVEEAFAGDPDVLTVSVHAAGAWPHSGGASRPAQGVWNFPLPNKTNDSEYARLIEERVLPLIASHQPEAIFLLPGADALADDPLGKLGLSNNAIWHAVRAVRPLAPRLVVGGGGGYNPFALARCWAGIWAILTGRPIPEILPDAAQEVLRGVNYFRAAGRNPPPHWLTTLRDAPNSGPIREEFLRMTA
jgi:acetoin utilization protein AcuC